MDSKEHLTQTLEHFRQQRTAKLQEIRSLEVIIRGLEQELGESASTQPAVESPVPPDTLIPPNANGASQQVRPDEFFGMTQTDAARAYLKKVGRAVSLDQLLEGMKRGGAHVGGTDPKNTLNVSLMRNPRQEFVKIGDGFIGLREFYPNLPKVTRNGARKNTKRQKKRVGKRSATRSPKTLLTDAGKGEERKPSASENESRPMSKLNPSEVKTEIKNILSDGHSHTREAIQKAVEQKLGRPVFILGYLGSRDFEKVGSEYRLKK